MCPGIIIEEYKEQLVSEGFIWDESRHNFVDCMADERLREIWLTILESMLFSFEWAANGEPTPSDCYKPNPLYKPQAELFIPVDSGEFFQINPEQGSQKVDLVAYQQFNQKIQAGFDNFGKYYQHLWD